MQPTRAEVQAHLREDGRNRALRTFLQGLGVDVGIAVALLVTTVLGESSEWGDLQWAALGFTLTKTVLVTVASYVMRVYMDPSSRISTPLPPDQTDLPAAA